MGEMIEDDCLEKDVYTLIGQFVVHQFLNCELAIVEFLDYETESCLFSELAALGILIPDLE